MPFLYSASALSSIFLLSLISSLNQSLFLFFSINVFPFFFHSNHIPPHHTAPHHTTPHHITEFEPQRDQLDVMYNSDMGDMFDITEARVALQAKRIELMAECDANSKLQRRYVQSSSFSQFFYSFQPAPLVVHYIYVALTFQISSPYISFPSFLYLNPNFLFYRF